MPTPMCQSIFSNFHEDLPKGGRHHDDVLRTIHVKPMFAHDGVISKLARYDVVILCQARQDLPSLEVAAKNATVPHLCNIYLDIFTPVRRRCGDSRAHLD